jgi:hypothetical protein
MDDVPLRDACRDSLTEAFTSLAWHTALRSLGDAAPERRTPASELLEMMLRGRESDAVARVFVFLGLLFRRENFAQIHRGLGSKNAKVRATSRELIEHVVTEPLRSGVSAIVDAVSDQERLARGRSYVSDAPTDYEGLLKRLIAEAGDLGTLTAYHAVEIGLVELGRTALSRVHANDSASEFTAGMAAGTKELLSSRNVSEVGA